MTNEEFYGKEYMVKEKIYPKLREIFGVPDPANEKVEDNYNSTHEYEGIFIDEVSFTSPDEIKFRFKYDKSRTTYDAMGGDIGAYDDYDATVWYSGVIKGDEDNFDIYFKNDDPFSWSSHWLSAEIGIYLIDKYDSSTGVITYVENEQELDR